MSSCIYVGSRQVNIKIGSGSVLESMAQFYGVFVTIINAALA